MPDQVGGDAVFVIPAHAGIHDSQKHEPPIRSGVTIQVAWTPDQVEYDKYRRHGPPIESGVTRYLSYPRMRVSMTTISMDPGIYFSPAHSQRFNALNPPVPCIPIEGIFRSNSRKHKNTQPHTILKTLSKIAIYPFD